MYRITEKVRIFYVEKIVSSVAICEKIVSVVEKIVSTNDVLADLDGYVEIIEKIVSTVAIYAS